MITIPQPPGSDHPGALHARTSHPDGVRETQPSGTQPSGSHPSGSESPEATSSVRPYAVTGGRTAPSAQELPLEALVEGLGASGVGMTPEKRTILQLTASQYLSVAELSAHVRLPVPVVRVVLGDLVRAGAVRVHPPAALAPPPGARAAAGWSPASPLSVLEDVLNGISTL